MTTASKQGWIGVDLDGTLAEYRGWEGLISIGKPIPAMVERIKDWLAEGWEVRIFTARCTLGHRDERGHSCWNFTQEALPQWLRHAGLPHDLKATNVKDFQMVELWDDRAVTVEPNTGRALAPSNINRGIA